MIKWDFNDAASPDAKTINEQMIGSSPNLTSNVLNDHAFDGVNKHAIVRQVRFKSDGTSRTSKFDEVIFERMMLNSDAKEGVLTPKMSSVWEESKSLSPASPA